MRQSIDGQTPRRSTYSMQSRESCVWAMCRMECVPWILSVCVFVGCRTAGEFRKSLRVALYSHNSHTQLAHTTPQFAHSTENRSWSNIVWNRRDMNEICKKKSWIELRQIVVTSIFDQSRSQGIPYRDPYIFSTQPNVLFCQIGMYNIIFKWNRWSCSKEVIFQYRSPLQTIAEMLHSTCRTLYQIVEWRDVEYRCHRTKNVANYGLYYNMMLLLRSAL